MELTHMMGKIGPVLFILLVLTVNSASGSWTSFRGDYENSGSFLDDIGKISDLELEWEFKGDGAIQGAIVGNDEYLAFNTLNGSLYVLNMDGKLVYKRQVEGRLFNSPLLDENGHNIFIATGSGKVISYSLNDGKRVWNTTIGRGSSIQSSPKLKEDTLIVTSYDSNVYCLDPDTGLEIWNFTGCGGQIHTTPAFFEDNDRDLVIFGSCDGKLYALNRETGTEAWSFQAEYIPSSPSLRNGRVYFGSFDERLYCLNASDGMEIWNTTLGSSIFSSPSISDDHVSAASDDGKLHLLDPTNGDLLWSIEITDSSLETSPVLIKEHVLVTYSSGLAILSLKDGARVRGFELGDSSETSPSVIDGSILFGDSLGYVRALAISEDPGKETLDIGVEDDPDRDILVIFIGIIILLGIGSLLYVGYLRIRRDE